MTLCLYEDIWCFCFSAKQWQKCTEEYHKQRKQQEKIYNWETANGTSFDTFSV